MKSTLFVRKVFELLASAVFFVFLLSCIFFSSEAHSASQEVLANTTYTKKETVSATSELIPQVIWTEGNQTLSFICDSFQYSVNDNYNGETITNVWRGSSVLNTTGYSSIPWRSLLYDQKIKYIVIEPSFINARPTNTSEWFSGQSIESIEGLTYINTSLVTDMRGMFRSCTGLVTSLDLSGFDTSNVADMSYMFYDCSYIFRDLDLSNFDTSNVTNMQWMFAGCKTVESIDLSSFNTSKVTDMSYMFDGCESLTTLDLSGFDTSNVTNMRGMFYFCKSLKDLDLSAFNTSKVTSMFHMFSYCTNLSSLDLRSFDTSNVTGMSNMFSYCESLQRLDLSGFDTSNVSETYLEQMFQGCKSLVYLDVSGFDTSNITSLNGLFGGCRSLTVLDISNFNTSNVIDINGIFGGCENLYSLNLSGFNTSKITDMSWLFCNCKSLQSLDLRSFDTSHVTDMTSMFEGCESLVSIDFSSFNTSRVAHMSQMFLNCKSLTHLDLGSFDASALTEMDVMFAGCEKLISLNLSGFAMTKSWISTQNVFSECKSLSTIYCRDSNTKWSEKYSDTIMYLSNLIGRYGDSVITWNNYYSGNTTVSAKYGGFLTPAHLCISYNSNGGYGSMPDSIVNSYFYSSGKTSLSKNTFEMEGYFFSGWNTEPDGSGIFYEDEALLNNPKTDLTLYAQWADLSASSAQVLWVSESSSVYFVFAPYIYSSGDPFRNEIVTGAWNVEDVFFSYEICEDIPSWLQYADAIRRVVIDKSFHYAMPTSTKRWFYNCVNLENIDGLENLCTTYVTDMNGMFCCCSNLTSINVSGFDTSNVMDMSMMFKGCNKLEFLDISLFDCSSLLIGDGIFSYCTNLKMIFCFDSDSNWNIVSPGCYPFYSCNALSGYYGEKRVPCTNSDGILYAKSAKLGGYFTPKYMKIRLSPNGGDGNTKELMVLSCFFDNNGSILPENTFSKENYLFLGWNTKADGSGQSYENLGVISPSSDLTLYAQWIKVGSWTWTRLAGKNRYHTAVLASEEVYENHSCEKIIIASGQVFPDALSGSALAGVFGCPILLTNKQKLSPDTKNEIQRLAASGCKVLILGGNGAVSADVEAEINNLSIKGLTTERVKGSNREATAAAVFELGLKAGGFHTGGTIIVATGYSYADVLSISPYSYAAKVPIILAKKDGSLSADTMALIEEKIRPSQVIIIGGSKAVSQEVQEYLSFGGTVKVMRLSGSNRYVTSAEIMRWELGMKTDAPFQPEVEMHAEGMGVATGANFADALGAVSLLGKTSSVMLLVADNNANNTTATQTNISELISPFTKQMKKGYIFGGKGAVSLQIEQWLNEVSQ